MKYIQFLACLLVLHFGCTLSCWSTDKVETLKALSDCATSLIGKSGFMPLNKQHLSQAFLLNDTTEIDLAYNSRVKHYYRLGQIDSLKIASYDYMAWCEQQQKMLIRYQVWREYVQRLTEKGMQEEAIAETECLRKDAEQRKSKYGQACSEMCIGYNHRVFSNNNALCIDYYQRALNLFETSDYCEDAYVVYLNVAQIYLSRSEYAQATTTLERLNQLTIRMERNHIAVSESLLMRFYQFRVIATLSEKGAKAAEQYVRETNQYYRDNPTSVTPDAWYGYKILCCRTLNNSKGALVYLDSLEEYHRSIGNCYPSNYLLKAQLFESIGNLKEACRTYADYVHLNDSVRTVEMNDQLSKYTVQFEVDKLKMDKLELNAENSRERLLFSIIGGCIILILLFILSYYYLRTLAMNKQLDAANRAVVQISRMKSSFIQHITHEIRTPLNSVVGFSSLLASGGLSEEEGREFSEQIESNNRYLLDLISNVIDIADMDSQADEVPKRKVDVHACCQECLAEIRPTLKEDIDLRYFPSTESLSILTVRPWMKRVLLSLLNNANKFTQSGTITLCCVGDKQRHLVRFIIEDTGCGIDAKYKEVIFERFMKIDSFTPGVGLGLSVAVEVMTLVGGCLFLDTSYSDGARFVVEWPMA